MMFKALIPFLLCALIAPSIGWAQDGRTYVSVEAYVGLARAVHVGTIVELEQIEYEKPLTGNQELGKPYRLCLLYTSPSPRDATLSRMPSSA